MIRKAIRLSMLVASAATALVLSQGLANAGDVTWWTPNFNEARAKKLVADFEKSHSDIKINLQITTTQGLPQRILTTLQSGSTPDIIDAQYPWVVGYAQNDLVVPVGNLIDHKDDYNKASIDYVTWKNKIWAVPYRVEALGVIYNRGMFKAAGLDPDHPPQTWDELLKDAKALTKGRQYGFAITGGGEVGNTIFRSLPFIWMNGGDLISKDGKTAVVNKPAAVQAVKFWTDLYTKYKVSPPSTLENDGLGNRRLFVAKTVAMYQTGQYDLKPIRDQKAGIDIGAMMTPHPKGKHTSAILGGWAWVIPKDAPNKKDAETFVKFLAQTKNMGYFTDTFPARKSAMDMPRFKNPDLVPFGKMLPYARALRG